MINGKNINIYFFFNQTLFYFITGFGTWGYSTGGSSLRPPINNLSYGGGKPSKNVVNAFTRKIKKYTKLIAKCEPRNQNWLLLHFLDLQYKPFAASLHSDRFLLCG